MEKSFNEEYAYNLAKEWTIEAGRKLVQSFSKEIKIEYKTSAADLVTEKDKEIESFFIDNVKKHFPEHFILGEEGQAIEKEYKPTEEIVWIIDPIDGTTNFVHQQRNFSISVALYDKGNPIFGFIYDPVQEELFHGIKGKGAYLNGIKLPMMTEASLEEAILSLNPTWLAPNEKFDYKKFHQIIQKSRGIRYVGSAALEMAYVACGRLDAYFDFWLSPWDIAAGLIILEEVGIKSTTVENKPVDLFNNTTNFVSKAGLHEEVINLLSN